MTCVSRHSVCDLGMRLAATRPFESSKQLQSNAAASLRGVGQFGLPPPPRRAQLIGEMI